MHGLDLPDTEEFDEYIDLNLTRKQTNEMKNLLQQKNTYRWISHKCTFDYLPSKSKKSDPAVLYHLPFRIVRFPISDNSYEVVVTNLDAVEFPSDELKKLYGMKYTEIANYLNNNGYDSIFEYYQKIGVKRCYDNVAKNYLSEQEMRSLERIVSAYLDLAEDRAERYIPMTMEDWAKRLDLFLMADDREILQDAGKITAEIAKAKAETEFEKYRVIQDRLFMSDFDKYMLELEENAKKE